MNEARFDRYDVPVVPGRNETLPPMTFSSPPVRLDLGNYRNASTLWRASRLILAWVAIVLIVQLIIGMGLAMAAGASIVSRLADPTCVGEVCE